MTLSTLPTTPLLTTAQVAEHLSLSESTVKGLARSGRLPAYRVGSQWRFATEDVAAYLDGVRTAPATPVSRVVRAATATIADLEPIPLPPGFKAPDFEAARRRRETTR